jgi:hypothetical protein
LPLLYFSATKVSIFFKYSAFENFKNIFFLIGSFKIQVRFTLFFTKKNVEIQPKNLITTYLKHDYLENPKQNNKPAIHQL